MRVKITVPLEFTFDNSPQNAGEYAQLKIQLSKFALKIIKVHMDPEMIEGCYGVTVQAPDYFECESHMVK